MTLQFPDTPTDGQTYSPVSGVVYTYEAADDVWRSNVASLDASALNDLTDVTLAGLTTGHLLRYDGVGWVNAFTIAAEVTNTPAGNITAGDVQGALNQLDGFITALPPAKTDLNSLDDVNVPTPANSQVLKWLTNEWVAATLAANNVSFAPTGTISATNVQGALSELDDDIVANASSIATNASDIATLSSEKVSSDVTQGGTGSLQVTNMVRISQANYDALTPDPNTLYLIDS